MSKIFHSRVYGAMNKQQRRKLGLSRHRREEVWRLMEAQEAKLRAAISWRPKRWWRRMVDWILRLFRGRL